MGQQLSNFSVIQGNTSVCIGDPPRGIDQWREDFGTGGMKSGTDAILMFMVAGLTVTENDVPIYIHNGSELERIGKIENCHGAHKGHWFTQIVNIEPNILRVGTNTLVIDAVNFPGMDPRDDKFDDFFIKNVICFFKKVD